MRPEMNERYPLSKRGIETLRTIYQQSRRPPLIIPQKRSPKIWPAGADIRIFEVVSKSTGAGDGVYNCREQEIDATYWSNEYGVPRFQNNANENTIEVLNLEESDGAYFHADLLRVGDKLYGWRMNDNEFNKRYVGKPFLSTGIHRAFCSQNAPGSDYILAQLNYVGGQTIEVYCDIVGGGGLSSALPLLKTGTSLSVYWLGEEVSSGASAYQKWYCTMIFQHYKACNCGL